MVGAAKPQQEGPLCCSGPFLVRCEEGVDDFSSEEWARLSLCERVQRCRLIAEEAKRFAEDATGEVRLMYLSVARGWERLAQDLQSLSNSFSAERRLTP